MKRLRMLVALGVVAVALPLGLTTAHATGTTSSVTIHEQADYDAVGFVIDVGLNVRCSGGVNGLVDVTVNQYPPETPYPVTAATGPQTVVCDGKSHTVAVTTVGEGFDGGRAKATATLTVPMQPQVTVTRWITIVEV